MYTTIDAVRRECTRLGTLLNKGDDAARSAITGIQVEAELPGAAGNIEALSVALEDFRDKFSPLLETRAAEKAPR